MQKLALNVKTLVCKLLNMVTPLYQYRSIYNVADQGANLHIFGKKKPPPKAEAL